MLLAHKLTLVQSFVLAAALHAFLGCSSDVTTPFGGGGSGTGGAPGEGGAPDTNTSAGGMISSGGAPTTTSSGGQAEGGSSTGSDCEQVCANVMECFDQSCDAIGVDCADPDTECPSACLVDASCAELAAVAQNNPSPRIESCLQGCDNGQGGGPQGGGSQGGGGPGQPCGQCMFQNGCLAPCMNNPSCQGWGQCAFNCADPACYSDCNAQFPQAEPFYTQIYECGCTSCDAACGAQIDPCNQPMGN